MNHFCFKEGSRHWDDYYLSQFQLVIASNTIFYAELFWFLRIEFMSTKVIEWRNDNLSQLNLMISSSTECNIWVIRELCTKFNYDFRSRKILNYSFWKGFYFMKICASQNYSKKRPKNIWEVDWVNRSIKKVQYYDVYSYISRK